MGEIKFTETKKYLYIIAEKFAMKYSKRKFHLEIIENSKFISQVEKHPIAKKGSIDFVENYYTDILKQLFDYQFAKEYILNLLDKQTENIKNKLESKENYDFDLNIEYEKSLDEGIKLKTNI